MQLRIALINLSLILLKIFRYLDSTILHPLNKTVWEQLKTLYNEEIRIFKGQIKKVLQLLI